MTAEIIPFKIPGKAARVCSFCKRNESACKKIFSNEMEGEHLKCICDKCVLECAERMSYGYDNTN